MGERDNDGMSFRWAAGINILYFALDNLEKIIHKIISVSVRESWVIRCSLGCVNSHPSARGSQEVGLTQPRALLIAHLCRSKGEMRDFTVGPTFWLQNNASLSDRRLFKIALQNMFCPLECI